jgi:hypothetical protein
MLKIAKLLYRRVVTNVKIVNVRFFLLSIYGKSDKTDSTPEELKDWFLNLLLFDYQSKLLSKKQKSIY